MPVLRAENILSNQIFYRTSLYKTDKRERTALAEAKNVNKQSPACDVSLGSHQQVENSRMSNTCPSASAYAHLSVPKNM